MCSRSGGGDGNRSSVSSEGFCENDTDIPDISESQVVLRQGCAQLNNCGDTDSQVIILSFPIQIYFILMSPIFFSQNYFTMHRFRKELVASHLPTVMLA